MYELMILTLLARGPMHGYLLAKIINDIFGPFVKVSNGTLYPLLARLEKAGLIVAVEDGDASQNGERQARAFKITEEGFRRFHQLMMDTSSNLGDYQRIFRFKVSALYHLNPAERLHLINHYINFCQAYILYYKAEAEDFVHEHSPDTPPEYVESTLDSMRHKAHMWEVELEWTLQVRTRESARIEQQTAQQSQKTTL